MIEATSIIALFNYLPYNPVEFETAFDEHGCRYRRRRQSVCDLRPDIVAYESIALGNPSKVNPCKKN